MFTCSTCYSGSAIVIPTAKGFAATNLMTGVDIFDFPLTQLLRTYTHNITHNIRLQLTSVWNGQLVVVGSDDGQPRVINTVENPRNNPKYFPLPHGDDWVQTITVCLPLNFVSLYYRPPFQKASDAPSGSLVATATSKADSHSIVKVWRFSALNSDGQGDGVKSRSLNSSLNVRQLALIAILCCLMQVLTSQLPLNALSAILSTPPSLQANVSLSSGPIPSAPPSLLAQPPLNSGTIPARSTEEGLVETYQCSSNLNAIEGTPAKSGVSALDLDLWRESSVGRRSW